jgi:uncharacterized protein (DUF1778 family)
MRWPGNGWRCPGSRQTAVDGLYVKLTYNFDSKEFAMPSTPTQNSSTDSARINLRTSPEVKALIERAAALMGSTVSSYISQTMYETSQRVVAEQDTLTLSDRDRDAFLDALESPAKPTQALIDLLKLSA